MLQKLRHVYSSGQPEKYLLPDAALPAFMNHCATRLGDAYFRTPRTTITAFINLLAVLEQNPGVEWASLLDGIEVAKDAGGDAEKLVAEDDELASFKL